jgi:hypothetical protein
MWHKSRRQLEQMRTAQQQQMAAIQTKRSQSNRSTSSKQRYDSGQAGVPQSQSQYHSYRESYQLPQHQQTKHQSKYHLHKSPSMVNNEDSPVSSSSQASAQVIPIKIDYMDLRNSSNSKSPGGIIYDEPTSFVQHRGHHRTHHQRHRNQDRQLEQQVNYDKFLSKSNIVKK